MMGIDLLAALIIPVFAALFKRFFEILKDWGTRSQPNNVKLKITSKTGQAIEFEFSPNDMPPEKLRDLIRSLENRLETDERIQTTV